VRPILSDEELAKRFFARGVHAANSANDYSGDDIYLRESTIYAAACFSVASALRLASGDTRPEGGDSTKIEAPFTGGAVPEGQTPK
jgi:hypothetical protein